MAGNEFNDNSFTICPVFGLSGSNRKCQMRDSAVNATQWLSGSRLAKTVHDSLPEIYCPNTAASLSGSGGIGLISNGYLQPIGYDTGCMNRPDMAWPGNGLLSRGRTLHAGNRFSGDFSEIGKG